jgi:acetyl esterase
MVLFRLRGRCAGLFMLLFVLATYMPAQVQPAGQPVVYKTVGGTPLHLYISSPPEEGSALHPAIVFFHGGGWTGGAVTQFNPQSTALAARGMVAVDVEYRLIAHAPSLESPQICVEDAKSAMRWVRAHAKELHIDPSRIAASGGSAGGYLAAATALVPGWDDPADDLSISPKPSALVLFFPVVDISPAAYDQKRFGNDPAKYSPESYLSASMPPTIIFAGLADKLVKPDTLRNFKTLATKAGGRCDIIFYPDQPHGFANKEPYMTITLTETIHFLKALGYLSATTLDPDPPVHTPAPTGP